MACISRTREAPALVHPQDICRPACQRGTGKDWATSGEDKRPFDESLPHGYSGLEQISGSLREGMNSLGLSPLGNLWAFWFSSA